VTHSVSLADKAKCLGQDSSEMWIRIQMKKAFGRFHQHLTKILYARRFKKHKNDSQAVSLFFNFGICGVKAAREMLMKLTPDGDRERKKMKL